MRCPVVIAGVVLAASTALRAQQPLDTAYTRQIRELTSEPRFNTPLTDHLPEHEAVPSPLDVLGYVPGTIGRLSHVADVNRYFRALAAATPRARLYDIGRSDEGREMIALAIGDSTTIAGLDGYREVTRRLADPRGLSDDDARRLIARGKPIYYVTGSIHSPETGSPEMLMELAYRLVVEDGAMFDSIRSRVVTVITPILEVDGRDRMVDVYNYGRAHGVRPPLVYWGRYTAHDNNRDGMVLSQVLTRTVLAQYFYWHPTIMHDLHESVPFLYTSTGTGPYNDAIDAITVNEWHQLAFHEVNELTKYGLPGVWTHDFYDGWAPNYVMFIANLRNSVGRFYETYTSNGADCDTARVRADQRSVQWFRANPPLDGVRWCIRNNLNYQQSGVLTALAYTADHGRRFLENFWMKSRRAVERARTGSRQAWVIPADQSRRLEAAALVNLFRQHGIEVRRASAEFAAGGVSVAAGDYVILLDQPYGPMADNLLGIQTYRPSDPRPYDDTGWTMGPLRGVVTLPVSDTAVFSRPTALLDADVQPRGEVADGGGRSVLLVPATSESALLVFRYRIRDVRVLAAEDSFTVGARRFAAGTFIIPVERGQEAQVREAVETLGLRAVSVRREPEVARHEVDLPRIGLVHSWQNTQNEGWVRYAFDRFGVPYTYLSTQQLSDSARLAGLDVLFLPYISSDARAIVTGSAMNGPPVPWRRTPETPNLGVIDQTDDVRPGIGLAGMATVEAWIRRGGVLITEGATAAVPVDFGLAPGVSVEDGRQLNVRGAVVRAAIRDGRSPIAYGYDDTLAVYFSSGPLLRADTADRRPSEIARSAALEADERANRPRVVARFHHRVDSLRVSGLLEGGGELAGRPAVLDVPLGRGHVVLFAIRPFWRWETQGSFGFAFNALMHWNDLSAGWPPAATPARAPGGRRGRLN